jgi:hypothetical protein
MSLPKSFQEKVGAISLADLDENFTELDNRTKNIVDLINWVIQEQDGALKLKYNNVEKISFGPAMIENSTTIDTNYTISEGKNAMTAGPVTISDGVTVAIPDGSTWTIV